MYAIDICTSRSCSLTASICAALLLLSLQAFGSEPANLYFPPANGEWESITPADAGWNKQKLEQFLQYTHEQNSSGLLVLYEGRILAERYWPVASAKNLFSKYNRLLIDQTEDGRALEDVASAQKSIVSFLIAVARDKQLLDIDRSVTSYLGKGWSNASTPEEDSITMRHLMSMTSGLTNGLKYANPPGKIWKYNTAAYSKTIPVLSAATGKSIHELTEVWLTNPTGMEESNWQTRIWALLVPSVNSIGYVTSTRDLAKFGLLVLANGSWDGKPLIKDAGLLQEALRPSQQMNPAYGLLWWLNRPSGHLPGQVKKSGSLIATAPDDMVAMQGALDRVVYIIPSRRLVVARLGDSTDKDFGYKFWQLLSAALP